MDGLHESTVELLAAALRGEEPPWPARAPAGFEERVRRAALDHGVAPFIHESTAVEAWPEALVHRLAEAVRTEVAVEAAQSARAGEATGALAAAGAQVLVVKGTALAHTLYPEPWLRPRDDTDLLIPPSQRELCARVLADLGYEAAPSGGGEAVHQACHVLTDARGIRHNLDVHWRLSNRPHLGVGLDHETLWEGSEALPAPLDSARTPGTAHALLIACVHLDGHHRYNPRLIWLVDLVRLIGALTLRDAEAVAARAIETGADEAVGRTLALAVAVVDLHLRGTLAALADAHAQSIHDHADSRLAQWVTDLRALETWGERVALLRARALPPASYMLERHGVRSRAWLPVLYLGRGLRGVARLLRPEADGWR